jgi:hypothetical protein
MSMLALASLGAFRRRADRTKAATLCCCRETTLRVPKVEGSIHMSRPRSEKGLAEPNKSKALILNHFMAPIAPEYRLE